MQPLPPLPPLPPIGSLGQTPPGFQTSAGMNLLGIGSPVDASWTQPDFLGGMPVIGGSTWSGPPSGGPLSCSGPGAGPTSGGLPLMGMANTSGLCGWPTPPIWDGSTPMPLLPPLPTMPPLNAFDSWSGGPAATGAVVGKSQDSSNALPVAAAPLPSTLAPEPQDDSDKLDELRADLENAESMTKAAAEDCGAFVGVVSRLSVIEGTGAIECQETAEKYHGAAEVVIPRDQLIGLQVGDTVVFQVNAEQPGRAVQASFARKVAELSQQRQRILAWEAPLPAPGAQESAQEYTGNVASFQPSRGFGYLSCPQTKQLYGSDVLIHRDQFTELCVGDSVLFRVALNPKGVPVARGVRRSAPQVVGAFVPPVPERHAAPPPPPQPPPVRAPPAFVSRNVDVPPPPPAEGHTPSPVIAGARERSRSKSMSVSLSVSAARRKEEKKEKVRRSSSSSRKDRRRRTARRKRSDSSSRSRS